MREIVIDTETTGLDYKTGDRIIEVGCVELKNYIPTGDKEKVRGTKRMLAEKKKEATWY